METVAVAVRKQSFEVMNKHMCPNCRGAMVEVDRIRENGYSFIWYECVRPGCDGQWLEKHRVN
jgi:hypothetical protein